MVAEVEILTFEGCPHAEAAIALVREVAAELGATANLRIVQVPDSETAERLRFLGSPTVRVNGKDVEPGAEARREFMLACRIYRTRSGQSGLPERSWVHDALHSVT